MKLLTTGVAAAALLTGVAPATATTQAGRTLPNGRTVYYYPPSESAPAATMFIRNGNQLTMLDALPATAFCFQGRITNNVARLKNNDGSRTRVPLSRLGRPTTLSPRKALHKVVLPDNPYQSWKKIKRTC